MYRHEKKVNDVTNRTSIKKKVISPEEVYRNRRKPILPSDKDPEYTYGIPTRPPSPFNKVISYHYYREFEKKQEEDKKKELLHKQKLRHEHFEKMAAPVYMLSNLASKRVQKKEEDPRKLFKMKKFSHASPKIDSWWTLPPGSNTLARLQDDYGQENAFESNPTKKPQSKDKANETITEDEYHQYTENLPKEDDHDINQRHPCHCKHDTPEEQYHCQQEIPDEEYEYEQEIQE